MKRHVIIVGGGAAGMTAAIAAARRGAAVTILEHTARVGKKILSTGNGKCNITNLSMPEGAYRGNQPEFALQVIKQVSVEKTLEFFRELGILTTDRNGYVYPNSGQASSVLDALRFELEHLKVTVVCDCQVKEIRKNLTVITNTGTYKGDAVILAAGSKAVPKTGSDGSGYQLAKSLGHTIIKPLPALVQLKCRESWYKQLAGIRLNAEVLLKADGKIISRDQGEVQFTDYGISGIPVFQVSRYAARGLEEGKKIKAVLDFFPDTGNKELLDYLINRQRILGYRTSEEFLNGVLNKKLTTVLLKEAGINFKQNTAQISRKQIERLTELLKGFTTEITGVNGFEQAQICSGGIDTAEIHPETMESKLIKNLYIAGEILDVDGICGGYNLQWAWSSGILAGASAAMGNAEKGRI